MKEKEGSMKKCILLSLTRLALEGKVLIKVTSLEPGMRQVRPYDTITYCRSTQQLQD